MLTGENADSLAVDTKDSTGTVEGSQEHLREQMVRAGVSLTIAACVTGALYALATWEHQNRGLLLALFGVGMSTGFAIRLLKPERILRSRYADVFFVTWSLTVIALIAVGVAVDGGARSPLTFVFFLPMVYAAVFYPLRLFVPVGAADMIAFVLVADLYGDPEPTYVAFIAACLAFSAVLCAWQSQNHDRHREHLTRMSRTDPLTGCFNRRGFEERMTAELDAAARGGRSVALVLFDLDNFKAVNDMNGHAAGDELLCWVVEGLNRAVRPMDSVGRLGGDEFAIIAPGAGESGAERIATRARKLLSERVAVTTGIASFPAHGADHDELQRHADRQLYDNKHGDDEHFTAGRRELTWAATLARAVDARMATPIEHSTIVARYAAGIAERLGWSGADLAHLRIAAMLHDIGKVVLPDRILQKPDSLDALEFEEVKRHPEEGAELINRVEGMGRIADWVRHSHEHFDGSGYPDGLTGDAIPLASRILLVADAFDAMTSDRPYRSAQSQTHALAELRANAGRQFDPRCVDALDQFLVDTGLPLDAEAARPAEAAGAAA
jgi:diguanylate cyclase (GGDEF)-like protein/putative nucleotidyltransferase with HDIG domain